MRILLGELELRHHEKGNILKHQLVLSSALLIAKYFIYKCSLTEELLLFELFKLQFYDHGMTERYLAIKNRSSSTFNEKWQPFIVSNFIPPLQ